MVHNTRQKFIRANDWIEYLKEVQKDEKQINLYQLRQNCYKDIETIRGRPLLVYSVKFPINAVTPGMPPPISIDLDDVDGFTDLVNSIEGNEVDILLHSPGGSLEATERIVELLRNRFVKVCFLVPHSAYSAATMLALSGDEIVMHPSACLGPIDPQINGVPARALKRGFDKAKKALKDEGPESLPAYVPLIEKLSIELLEICEDSDQLSKEIVRLWLSKYMFKNDESKIDIVENAVSFFSDYDLHRTHNRPLTFMKINHLKLLISLGDKVLQDLLREAHILIDGFFNISPFVKIYENSYGLSWGKQWLQNVQQKPQKIEPPK